MKLSKKVITIGITGTLAVAMIATTIFIGLQKKPAITADIQKQTSSTDIVIKLPNENQTESGRVEEINNASNPSLIVDVNGNSQISNNNINNKTPAKEPAKPITPATPSQPENNGINIEGSSQQIETAYNCNTPNHHCINSENHAYITNLELQGCPYCGSHFCPSFYYVSPAGIPICNPTLCPKYDVKKDPIKYCQTCGRPNGDGSNGTCQKFIVDTVCPICGVLVKAHECHTHS
jgi:hypothetical protein